MRDTIIYFYVIINYLLLFFNFLGKKSFFLEILNETKFYQFFRKKHRFFWKFLSLINIDLIMYRIRSMVFRCVHVLLKSLLWCRTRYPVSEILGICFYVSTGTDLRWGEAFYITRFFEFKYIYIYI